MSKKSFPEQIRIAKARKAASNHWRLFALLSLAACSNAGADLSEKNSAAAEAATTVGQGETEEIVLTGLFAEVDFDISDLAIVDADGAEIVNFDGLDASSAFITEDADGNPVISISRESLYRNTSNFSGGDGFEGFAGDFYFVLKEGTYNNRDQEPGAEIPAIVVIDDDNPSQRTKFRVDIAEIEIIAPDALKLPSASTSDFSINLNPLVIAPANAILEFAPPANSNLVIVDGKLELEGDWKEGEYAFEIVVTNTVTGATATIPLSISIDGSTKSTPLAVSQTPTPLIIADDLHEQIDLDGYFTGGIGRIGYEVEFVDEDGNPSTEEAGAKIGVVGEKLVVYLAELPSARVKVTATDQSGATREIFIEVNDQGPVGVADFDLEQSYMTNDDLKLYIADAFSHPEAQQLRYSAKMVESGAVLDVVAGDIVLDKSLRQGEHVIELVAEELGVDYAESMTVRFTVDIDRTAEAKTTIADLTLSDLPGNADHLLAKSFELTDYFHLNSDDDATNWMYELSGAGFRLQNADGQAKIFGDLIVQDEEIYRVTAREQGDSEGATIEFVVRLDKVPVLDRNYNLPASSVKDNGDFVHRLASVFQGGDGELTITASAVVANIGMTLAVTTMDEQENGETQTYFVINALELEKADGLAVELFITATDEDGDQATQTVDFDVDKRPEANAESTLQLALGDSVTQLNMNFADYFQFYAPESLSYAYELVGSNNGSIQGKSSLDFALGDFLGGDETSIYRIVASDLDGDTATVDVTLAIDSAPTVETSGVTNKTPTGNDAVTYNLSDLFTAGSGTLSLFGITDSDTNASVSAQDYQITADSDGNLILNLAGSAFQTGINTFVVTVQDVDGDQASTTLTVVADKTPYVSSQTPGLIVMQGEDSLVIDANDFFMHPDGEAFNFFASVMNPGDVLADSAPPFVFDSEGKLTVLAEMFNDTAANGEATLVITATDQDSSNADSVEISFKFEVNHAGSLNAAFAPNITSIDGTNQTIAPDKDGVLNIKQYSDGGNMTTPGSVIIDLSDAFLQNTEEKHPTTVTGAGASYDADTGLLTISPAAEFVDGYYDYVMSFTANNITETATLSVRYDRLPVLSSATTLYTYHNIVNGNDSLVIDDVQDFFEDGSGVLTYSINSAASNLEPERIYKNNSTDGYDLYFSPVYGAEGLNNIVLVATDGDGDAIETTLTIDVDYTPYLVGPTQGSTVKNPGTLETISFVNRLKYQGEGALSYSVNYLGSEIESTSEFVFDTSNTKNGKHTFTLTATDDDGDSVTTEYHLTLDVDLVANTAATTTYDLNIASPTLDLTHNDLLGLFSNVEFFDAATLNVLIIHEHEFAVITTTIESTDTASFALTDFSNNTNAVRTLKVQDQNGIHDASVVLNIDVKHAPVFDTSYAITTDITLVDQHVTIDFSEYLDDTSVGNSLDFDLAVDWGLTGSSLAGITDASILTIGFYTLADGTTPSNYLNFDGVQGTKTLMITYGDGANTFTSRIDFTADIDFDPYLVGGLVQNFAVTSSDGSVSVLYNYDVGYEGDGTLTFSGDSSGTASFDSTKIDFDPAGKKNGEYIFTLTVTDDDDLNDVGNGIEIKYTFDLDVGLEAKSGAATAHTLNSTSPALDLSHDDLLGLFDNVEFFDKTTLDVLIIENSTNTTTTIESTDTANFAIADFSTNAVLAVKVQDKTDGSIQAASVDLNIDVKHSPEFDTDYAATITTNITTAKGYVTIDLSEYLDDTSASNSTPFALTLDWDGASVSWAGLTNDSVLTIVGDSAAFSETATSIGYLPIEGVAVPVYQLGPNTLDFGGIQDTKWLRITYGDGADVIESTIDFTYDWKASLVPDAITTVTITEPNSPSVIFDAYRDYFDAGPESNYYVTAHGTTVNVSGTSSNTNFEYTNVASYAENHTETYTIEHVDTGAGDKGGESTIVLLTAVTDYGIELADHVNSNSRIFYLKADLEYVNGTVKIPTLAYTDSDGTAVGQSLSVLAQFTDGITPIDWYIDLYSLSSSTDFGNGMISVNFSDDTSSVDTTLDLVGSDITSISDARLETVLPNTGSVVFGDFFVAGDFDNNNVTDYYTGGANKSNGDSYLGYWYNLGTEDKSSIYFISDGEQFANVGNFAGKGQVDYATWETVGADLGSIGIFSSGGAMFNKAFSIDFPSNGSFDLTLVNDSDATKTFARADLKNLYGIDDRNGDGIDDIALQFVNADDVGALIIIYGQTNKNSTPVGLTLASGLDASEGEVFVSSAAGFGDSAILIDQGSHGDLLVSADNKAFLIGADDKNDPSVNLLASAVNLDVGVGLNNYFANKDGVEISDSSYLHVGQHVASLGDIDHNGAADGAFSYSQLDSITSRYTNYIEAVWHEDKHALSGVIAPGGTRLVIKSETAGNHEHTSIVDMNSGDINGDGILDLVFVEQIATLSDSAVSYAFKAHVVYGDLYLREQLSDPSADPEDVAVTLDINAMTLRDGFSIDLTGSAALPETAPHVSFADTNNDGFDDLLISDYARGAGEAIPTGIGLRVFRGNENLGGNAHAELNLTPDNVEVNQNGSLVNLNIAELFGADFNAHLTDNISSLNTKFLATALDGTVPNTAPTWNQAEDEFTFYPAVNDSYAIDFLVWDDDAAVIDPFVASVQVDFV